ncbi:hypothetical protein B0H21DRAFT_770469 [Amylocystis lapponica]|nr:hypothetical protein B0H21DRAFT_770469 [Amylocystis lapponica]
MQRPCVPAAHTFMGRHIPINDPAKPNAPRPCRHAHLARAQPHIARPHPPPRASYSAPTMSSTAARPHLPPAPRRIPLRHGRPRRRRSQAVAQFARQRPQLHRLDLGSCLWELVRGVLPTLPGLRVRIAHLLRANGTRSHTPSSLRSPSLPWCLTCPWCVRHPCAIVRL